jgi:hypothetical protein
MNCATYSTLGENGYKHGTVQQDLRIYVNADCMRLTMRRSQFSHVGQVDPAPYGDHVALVREACVIASHAIKNREALSRPVGV